MTDNNDKILNDLLNDRTKLKSDGHDEIICIVDRSGSMGFIKLDAQGGINSFIEEQKKVGDASLTIIEFDSVVDVVCDQVNINESIEYKLIPRGCTALLDAIGLVISDKEKYETKTGKTIVVVITDGAENSSKEWTRDSIFELMKERENDGWEFLFLAAGQDAIDVGMSYGFSKDKSVTFEKSGAGMINAGETMSLYTSTVRSFDTKTAVAAKSAYVQNNLNTLSETGDIKKKETIK